jgi:hypothetical protein
MSLALIVMHVCAWLLQPCQTEPRNDRDDQRQTNQGSTRIARLGSKRACDCHEPIRYLVDQVLNLRLPHIVQPISFDHLDNTGKVRPNIDGPCYLNKIVPLEIPACYYRLG